MKELLYFSMAGAFGGLIGWATAIIAARQPGRIYREWIQECADILSQADELAGVRQLTNEQSQRAKQIGVELEAAIAGHERNEATTRRKATVAAGVAAAFVAVAALQPAGASVIACMAFIAGLAAMSAVDWDSTLLPDSMTLPFIWVGLCVSWVGFLGVNLHDAVAGAVVGYLTLRIMYEGHKAFTGQEGMGHGDFKLLAGIGAWLGWQAILPVLTVASLSALLVNASAQLRKKNKGSVIPFGPFLAAGAVATVLGGTQWKLQIG